MYRKKFDFMNMFLAVVTGSCALLIIGIILLFFLAIGESFQWWELNMISDCNDYSNVCSTQ